MSAARLSHLRLKSSVQRGAPGVVLKYGEDAPEVISRFEAKSNLQSPALPGFGDCGA